MKWEPVLNTVPSSFLRFSIRCIRANNKGTTKDVSIYRNRSDPKKRMSQVSVFALSICCLLF